MGETGEQQEVGFRFFGGVAGGAVMIGDPPDVDAFHEHFDWPDAVIYLPYGSADVADLIADLDRQPERLARISNENVANALLRHDWAYRWSVALSTMGIESALACRARKARLAELTVSEN